jgi:hypothetical protein
MINCHGGIVLRLPDNVCALVTLYTRLSIYRLMTLNAKLYI